MTKTTAVLCLVLSCLAQPVFAASCDVSIGDYKLVPGDIKKVSVVGATNTEAVLGENAGKKIDAIAKASSGPVPFQIGSTHLSLPMKDMLSERGPMFFKDKIITIPGQNNSDALVMQQVLNTCL